ncbi:hypothetical protein [Methylobacterium nigriterrae]|uniref:hypothetical protein n=1 Tax=Methylobacterium nigriterrae TaxID=3127512 RepID=UPI00301387FE
MDIIKDVCSVCGIDVTVFVNGTCAIVQTSCRARREHCRCTNRETCSLLSVPIIERTVLQNPPRGPTPLRRVAAPRHVQARHDHEAASRQI